MSGYQANQVEVRQMLAQLYVLTVVALVAAPVLVAVFR